MTAASRIAVEITGSSGELQAAAARAADSLKGLGDVLKRQADLSHVTGNQTIRVNEMVGKSFQGVAREAGLASEQTIRSFERQGAAAVNGARTVESAYARSAEAAKVSASEQASAVNRIAVAEERQAEAAKVSANQQVRANDLAAASAARKAQRDEESAAKSTRAFGSSSSQLTKVGKTITTGLLGAAAASVYLATKFQANSLRMQTQAGASTKQLDKLRKGILDMAPAVGFGPAKLADALYHVVSSMNSVLPPAQRVSTELAMLKAAAEGAQVGHYDLEKTTYALASAMNALHSPASDAQHVMGQLNAIVGSGDMTMGDLVEVMTTGIVPSAVNAGVSLQSMGSALAVMGDQGMKGAMAGTRLRMTIALLASPSQAAAKVLRTIGLSAQEATSRSKAMADALEKAGLRTTSLSADLHKPNGIVVALKDLQKHLIQSGLTATGAAAVIDKAFGGGRMSATLQLLLNSTDRVNSKFKQIGDTANQFASDWDKAKRTTATQMDQIKAGAEALGVRMGNVLLPVVNKAIRGFADFATWLSHGSVAARALEVAVGTLATVAIGSYLISKLQKAIQLFRELGQLARNPFAGMKNWWSGSAPTGGGSGGGTGSKLSGIGMISGSRGFEAPGSIPNPIVVAIEAGQFAGLSSMGAQGTVASENRAAQVESGAATQEERAATAQTEAAAAERQAAVAQTEAAAKGSAAPVMAPGSNPAAMAAEEEAAMAGAGAAGSRSMLSSLKSGLGSVFSRATEGAGIALMGTMVTGMVASAFHGGVRRAVSAIGTDASIGAGIGAIFGQPFAGALLGALLGVLTTVAKKLPTLTPGPYNTSLAKYNLAHTSINPTNGQLLAQHIPDGSMPITLPSGQRTVLSPQLGAGKDPFKMESASAQQATLDFKNMLAAIYRLQSGQSSINQTVGALQRLAGQAQKVGDVRWQFADKLGAEMLKSRNVMSVGVQHIVGQMNRLAPGARASASQAMTQMTQMLETAGRLPVGATARMVGQMLTHYSAMKDKGGVYFHALMGDASYTMNLLRNKIATSTGQQRADAIKAYKALQAGADDAFKNLLGNVIGKQDAISAKLKSGSASAAKTASDNFWGYATSVNQAENQGVLSAEQGSTLIARALNASLAAFGAPPIDFPRVTGTIGGIAKSFLHFGAASGGYVGNVGQRGADAVDVTVGRGEAILNHQQQAMVNGALTMAGIGGLREVFAATSGTRHYMASGGIAGGPGTVPMPTIEGTGTLTEIVRAALKLAAQAATAYLVAHAHAKQQKKKPHMATGGYAGGTPAAGTPTATTSTAAAVSATSTAMTASTKPGAQLLTRGMAAAGAQAMQGLAQSITGHSSVAVAAMLNTSHAMVRAYQTTVTTPIPQLTTTMVTKVVQTVAASKLVPTVQQQSTQVKTQWTSLRDTVTNTASQLETNVQSRAQNTENDLNATVTRQRVQVVNQYGQLRDQVTTDFEQMSAHVSQQSQAMTNTVTNQTSQAYQQGRTNIDNLERAIYHAMDAGVRVTAQGTTNIANDLNAALAAFQAPHIGIPSLQSGAGGNPLASGGYVGMPGEKGVDAIPAVLGRGEAVLNHQQQSIVNGALSATGIGTLHDVFSTTAGSRHHMASGGFAGAQRFDTGGIAGGNPFAAMVAKASWINAQHYPYVWGGGHNMAFAGPYDCSGAVSAVLHAGGLLKAPEVSGMLAGYGVPGPGLVTIYANPVHAFMSLGGRFFGTHGSAGAGWYAGSPLPGFAVRHAPLSGAGNLNFINVPKVAGGGTIAKLAQAALNKEGAAANAKVQQIFDAMTAGGGPGGGDWGTFNPGGPGGAGLAGLEQLWDQAGGPPNMAHIMAAIAMAESGGNAGARNPSGASGLWQILGLPFPGNPFDPLTNARMAVAKFRSQGLGAWVTWSSGAYRRFMASGGFAGDGDNDADDLMRQAAGWPPPGTIYVPPPPGYLGGNGRWAGIWGPGAGKGPSSTASMFPLPASPFVEGPIDPRVMGGGKVATRRTFLGPQWNTPTRLPPGLARMLGAAGGEGAGFQATLAKIQKALGKAGANTDLVSALQQWQLQQSEGLALNRSQTSVLKGMIPEIPKYDDGGPVLRDTVAMVHQGEHVVPKGGALVMRENPPPPPVVIEQHYHGDAQKLMAFVDQRVAAPGNVRVVSNGIGRRASGLRGAPGNYLGRRF